MDLLDFYRGTLSVRRLSVLVKQLPTESATSRAVNDGRIPWGNTEHLLADNWALTLQVLQVLNGEKRRHHDHPTRAEAEAKARKEAKAASVAELRAKNEKRKRTYELG